MSNIHSKVKALKNVAIYVSFLSRTYGVKIGV